MDGLTDPQGSGPDHSRLLTSPFNWDPASNFTSTLDMDAIAVSHTTDCSLSSEARSLSWDTEPGPGPPLLVPHHLDSPPRLEPAMVQESSSESESESEELPASLRRVPLPPPWRRGRALQQVAHALLGRLPLQDKVEVVLRVDRIVDIGLRGDLHL